MSRNKQDLKIVLAWIKAIYFFASKLQGNQMASCIADNRFWRACGAWSIKQIKWKIRIDRNAIMLLRSGNLCRIVKQKLLIYFAINVWKLEFLQMIYKFTN